MDSASLGQLRFLQCGEGRQCKTPPLTMPDTSDMINWAYQYHGAVDTATGLIAESTWKEPS